MNKFNSLNIGLGILLFIVIVAILAPFLNLHDPLKMNISLMEHEKVNLSTIHP